jgi:hypothetical protein
MKILIFVIFELIKVRVILFGDMCKKKKKIIKNIVIIINNNEKIIFQLTLMITNTRQKQMNKNKIKILKTICTTVERKTIENNYKITVELQTLLGTFT